MDWTERQALRNRSVTVSVGFSLTVLDVLDRLADREGVKLTTLVQRFVREGIDRLKDADQGKS